MVGNSSSNDQINLSPPRKLVRPQHWFTITLPMNEFFELESLSSESVTIFSHKICALYFYMCMSTYKTLWKPLSMLHRLHQEGRGATQRNFYCTYLYNENGSSGEKRLLQQLWSIMEESSASKDQTSRLSWSVCLFRCIISVLVPLPVAVIWVQGWDTQNTCIPKYWYLCGRHLKRKSKGQGKGRQMWWVQMGERSSSFSLLGAIHVLATIPFKCLSAKKTIITVKSSGLFVSQKKWIMGMQGSIHLPPSPFLRVHPLKTHWTSLALWTVGWGIVWIILVPG